MSALRRRFTTRRKAAPEDRHERQIVLLVQALLLFESSMWSAVTPILPHYQHLLHASKPALGILVAGYPAGMVPGSLLGAWLATRVGVRRPTIVGLLLFSVSIAGFGFATQIDVLDALRFVQGSACGLIWGGGLTWVVAVAPAQRRGAVLGGVFSAAIFGSLLGPVLGTLATAVGTEPVFSVVGAVALVLAVWTTRRSEPVAAAASNRTPLRAILRQPRIRLGFWLILLEAAALGAIGTLLPLRLSRFGASGVAIGATFVGASLISTKVSTPVGRMVDRRGAGLPLRLGLCSSALLTALLVIPHSALVLAILAMIALGGPLTAYTIPAMALITNTSDRIGVPLAFATLMLNLAWAFGEMTGAPTAAKLSAMTSDTVPLLLLSAVMLLTLWPVVRAHIGPEHRRQSATHQAPADGWEPEPREMAAASR
jgi:predicted MFS family arabinose efflux permease